MGYCMRLYAPVLLLCLCNLPLLAAAPPNVIVIMADDFGYECVTANGGQSYQTPQLDRLAAGGLRFEQGHSQPLCTPTRVQLMTGRYNIRNYVNFGTLIRSATTFGHLFKKAGYTTAICGKWQLGREKDSPQHFGFDESLLWQHTRRPPRYANAGLERNGVEQSYPEGSYGPTEINNFALDFITRNKAKPFFLYYPLILTHNPFQPTPDSPNWDPKTRGEQALHGNKHFADMTAYMDRMIGQVDAKLAELGIRDNTLLIFLGDNGTNKGITSRFKDTEYKGGKGSTVQNGHHVPFIASWPGVMKQGRVSQDLVTCADILPTICQAAGIVVPENLDGVSFLPQLRGEAGKPRESIYMWYSPRQQNNLAVSESAFDQHYKLYRTGDFYDLADDPWEQNKLDTASLTSVQTEAKAKLTKTLDQYKNARPAALDAQFKKNGPAADGDDGTPKGTKKGKQAMDKAKEKAKQE